MPEYEIMRWDAVIPKDNTLPYPMVYIKPDKNFLDYARDNKYLFLLNITGTGMDYDKMPVIGMTDMSGYFPNYRPNFFNETGYFVVVLFTNWIGYPENNGKIKLQGVQGPDNVGDPKPLNVDIPKPMFPEYYTSPNPEDDCKCRKLNSSQIGWMLMAVLIVFAVLLAISFRKKI